MKTIEINVYKFEELDKQTKEKVIENYRYINVEDTFWYDWIKDNEEKFLRANYEWEITDEAIIETIEANDYDFTTKGKIY